MGVCIAGVTPGSAAARAGIAPQHTLLSINGHEIRDVLDYRFYMTDTHLALLLLTPDGRMYETAVDKGEYDELGLEFDSYLMDEQRSCRNNCIFCFIDQMPPGLRDTLYFKDDDARMSFLFGNYITLTNLQERDVQRIIAMRISPVNISVHTMNPALRVKMMHNRFAGDALRYIPQLAGAGISINAQLVLCPGINDGDELEFSLRELGRYAPGVQSVAVVPVGLTKYRDRLAPLRLYTPDEARAVVKCIERHAEQMLAWHGRRVFHASDEFYLCAGLPFPDYACYEGFEQLENGVGMLPLLLHEFACALKDAVAHPLRRTVSIATGRAAYPAISQLARRAEEMFAGLRVRVVPVRNDFFGETITVAGLLTGQDILAQLRECGELGDAVLLPATTLRHERDLFLDSMPLTQLERELNRPVRVVESDGYDLLAAMLGE